MLDATPPERLVDRQGRPYFLWDMDLSVDEFCARLSDADPDVRAFFVGKLMREAKPDDVFIFVSESTIRELWPLVERHLGRQRDFWRWLLEVWDRQRAR